MHPPLRRQGHAPLQFDSQLATPITAAQTTSVGVPRRKRPDDDGLTVFLNGVTVFVANNSAKILADATHVVSSVFRDPSHSRRRGLVNETGSRRRKRSYRRDGTRSHDRIEAAHSLP